MSDSVLDNKIQQLVMSRDMFQRTGVIQDLQVLNLKLLPIAVLGDEKAVTEVDCEGRSARVILNSTKKTKIFTKKLSDLAISVQFVLGMDFNILVSSRKNPKKALFKLKRKEQKKEFSDMRLGAPMSEGSNPTF